MTYLEAAIQILKTSSRPLTTKELMERHRDEALALIRS